MGDSSGRDATAALGAGDESLPIPHTEIDSDMEPHTKSHNSAAQATDPTALEKRLESTTSLNKKRAMFEELSSTSLAPPPKHRDFARPTPIRRSSAFSDNHSPEQKLPSKTRAAGDNGFLEQDSLASHAASSSGRQMAEEDTEGGQANAPSPPSSVSTPSTLNHVFVTGISPDVPAAMAATHHRDGGDWNIQTHSPPTTSQQPSPIYAANVNQNGHDYSTLVQVLPPDDGVISMTGPSISRTHTPDEGLSTSHSQDQQPSPIRGTDVIKNARDSSTAVQAWSLDDGVISMSGSSVSPTYTPDQELSRSHAQDIGDDSRTDQATEQQDSSKLQSVDERRSYDSLDFVRPLSSHEAVSHRSGETIHAIDHDFPSTLSRRTSQTASSASRTSEWRKRQRDLNAGLEVSVAEDSEDTPFPSPTTTNGPLSASPWRPVLVFILLVLRFVTMGLLGGLGTSIPHLSGALLPGRTDRAMRSHNIRSLVGDQMQADGGQLVASY